MDATDRLFQTHVTYARSQPSRLRRSLRVLFIAALWLVLTGITLWAVGALAFDLPFPALRKPAAILYAVAVSGAAIFIKGRWRAARAVVIAFGLVLAWWLTLRPSNDRAWQPDVAQTAWAEIKGNQVTLHNVRNCEYRTETDYTPHWETRQVDLSKLRGMDIAIDYWGSPWMAHPIVSFDFEGAPRVAMSIETRKEIGESYSAIGGIYRQYELTYIIGDERDLMRVRTNFRKGEDLYLYHLRVPADHAREIFLEYLHRANALHVRAEFYNAITSNCTTNIRTQAAIKRPWDWRILLNGYADQMMYERGDLAGDLPFHELKKRALVNEAARADDADPDFSERIRAGRPGFDSESTAPAERDQAQ